MKKWVLLWLPLWLAASPALCAETLKLPCEVMETSAVLNSISGNINGVRYVLLHHAHSEDREGLSEWLKTFNGTDVTFIFHGEKFEGILCRLAHCFGRGLLIYTANIKPQKQDIIEVILPFPP